jgi:hypothetical protein
MSTLKVSTINNASATSGGLSIDAAGAVSGGLPSANRNLLYNGAMQVAQRGVSSTGNTGGGYLTADRWSVDISNAGTWTQDIQNDAPSGSGFRKSFRMLCTTADASLAAADVIQFRQQLEGQDLQRIAKGTASAQQLSLSFWVKSNATGTYTIYLLDNDNNRMVAASYTISASATWERKVISLPADTTGAFDNDNDLSLYVVWTLAAGTDYTSGTMQTAWGSTVAANRAVGQTNLAAATNNYWQITGVQLEVGPVATGFEFKSFGQELRECQRYFYMHAKGSTNQSIGMAAAFTSNQIYSVIQLPVTMRIGPVIHQVSGVDYFKWFGNNTNDGFDSFVLDYNTTTSVGFRNGAGAVSVTAGHAGFLVTNNASAELGFSAEL